MVLTKHAFYPECHPFSPVRFRFPLAGFHLAVLRTSLGPEAILRCFARLRAQATRLPDNLVRQNLLSAYPQTQVPRLSQCDPGSSDRSQICLRLSDSCEPA